MSIKIYADPLQLEQTATAMEQQSLNYEKQYLQLYAEIDKMQTAWQGKDNQAYSEQIKGFTNDFIKMNQLMKEYISFLRRSANLYRATQEELTSKARMLNS